MRSFTTILLGALMLFASIEVLAKGQVATYKVTITNLTPGQTFTPQLLTTHSGHVRLFELGQPSTTSLEILAEAGDTSHLTNELLAAPDQVSMAVTVPGLLGPGQSVSYEVTTSRQHQYLSMASMLIPTNDTFVAVDRLRLPHRGSRTTLALAYDAGTEANDQNCLNIPGPRCAGTGHSPGPNEGDEGFVHVSNGFHDLADATEGEVLGPRVYDWRNPVARIVVKRIY